MRFRYKDNRGKVVSLPDVASLLKAIREGAIASHSPLAVGDEKSFQRAELVAAYQQAAVAVSRSGGLPAAAETAARVRWYASTTARIGFAIAAVILLGMLAVWRIRTIDRRQTAQAAAAAAPTGPSPVARRTIAGIATEFGDSAAVAQHRLESWVERQRLPDRFRGSALHAHGSLRGVRTAAVRYRQEVDSLLVRSQRLALLLVQRADSTENANHGLSGLMASVEDVLVEWQRDLTVYAEIQRTAAAALDTLAAFMLDRQQSFAIREGQPVFLSRQDAARFRELTGTLGSVARQEKAWADALAGRRPGWMTSLAEAERPRFGRNIFSGPASN